MVTTETHVAHVVQIGDDNTITLPADVMQAFKPTDRFLVLRQGDTLILKRVDPVSYLERVASTPSSEPPLTLDEINEIVHEVRRKNREAC